MTTYDLDTLTLTNIGEEINDSNRQAYGPLFLNAYNEAYFNLCDNAIKPTAGKAVTLDESRQFSPTQENMKFARDGIVSVKMNRVFATEADFAQAPEYAFYWTQEGNIAVPAAPAAWQMYVIYHSLPAALTNATPIVPGSGSVPVLLPEQYHGALASYAASAFFRARRKFERMQVWMETYLSAVQGLQGKVDSTSLALRNIYTPMP